MLHPKATTPNSIPLLPHLAQRPTCTESSSAATVPPHSLAGAAARIRINMEPYSQIEVLDFVRLMKDFVDRRIDVRQYLHPTST